MSLATAALSYVGTPFVHQGRTPGVMLDCIGVGVCAARDSGLRPKDFDFNGYVQTASPTSIEDAMRAAGCSPVQQGDLRAGDFVVVRFRDGDPQHIGVVYDHPKGGLGMVHASTTHKKVIAHRLKFTAFMRFASGWRA